ncbi:shikimate dehydrogenase [Pengzhenrongella frigida]|uniref:Shikimate dehydrogenase n=1 Tax=Pengzhenrongella frigida TaxID=1259133 RepID=A0A4Q5N3U1_9MICO|nr:shikimate dehydrogenase [Cellulomonas sp. HLT2-17]
MSDARGGGAGLRRAAVLGHPVGHSLSPTLHRAAYAALGLTDWRYDAVDVTSDQLAEFVAGLDGTWAGLSLTMPLKQTVLPLLDHIEPLADVVGAVNTVLIQGTGVRRVLVGANTDVYGIVAALREGLDRRAGLDRQGGVPEVRGGAGAGSAPAGAPARSAAVLGAGATAASTLAALAQLGCPTPVVYVRSLGRIGSLMRAAHRMGVEPRYALLPTAAEELATFDLVVSTLPAHAADEVAAALGATAALGGVLLDVAYEPRPTALSLAWTRAGGVAVGGERMLLHQAVEQVRLMTGLPAPVDAMERALAGALKA